MSLFASAVALGVSRVSLFARRYALDRCTVHFTLTPPRHHFESCFLSGDDPGKSKTPFSLLFAAALGGFKQPQLLLGVRRRQHRGQGGHVGGDLLSEG